MKYKSRKLHILEHLIHFEFQFINIFGELQRHSGSLAPCGESIKQRKCHMLVQNHVTQEQQLWKPFAIPSFRFSVHRYMSLYKDGNYLNKTTSSVYSSIFLFTCPLLLSASNLMRQVTQAIRNCNATHGCSASMTQERVSFSPRLILTPLLCEFACCLFYLTDGNYVTQHFPTNKYMVLATQAERRGVSMVKPQCQTRR